MEQDKSEITSGLYWGVTPKQVPQDSAPTFDSLDKATKCTKCDTQFGFLSKKLNCHGCGKVFCKKDCDRWLLLPDSFKYQPVNTPVNVCQECYEKYNLVDYSRDYDEFGPKDAPTVVILPGALNPRIVPTVFMNGLKGYHIVSPDLPGYGKRQNETLTVENALEVVKDTILKYSPTKKALVLGFSMGGHLAMKFGQKYPELCDGLIFGACCNEYYGLKSDFFFASSKFVYDVAPNSMNSQIFLKVMPKEIDLSETRWIMAQGMQYHLWGPCGQIMAEPHEGFYRKALAELNAKNIPMIFIHGSKDYRTGEKAFKEAAPNAEWAIIDGADHFGILIPKYYNQMSEKVQEFADKVYAKK